MAEEYRKLLGAADTLAHVAGVLVAAGDKAENAAGAIYLAAARQPEKLSAYALNLSKSEAVVGSGWAWTPEPPAPETLLNRTDGLTQETAMKVAPRFWELMISAPLAFDWATGSFAAKASDVSDRDMEGRPELWVAGVRFRWQQVEAIWPFPPQATMSPPTQARSQLRLAVERVAERFSQISDDQLKNLDRDDWWKAVMEFEPRMSNGDAYDADTIWDEIKRVRRALHSKRGITIRRGRPPKIR